MDESRLTVLYTGNLAGRLDELPRLFALILQARSAARQPIALVDLGRSCAPAVPECAATEGRATLIVLEAMGYNAARVEHAFSPAAVEKLRDSLSMGVCSAVEGELPGAITWASGHWRVALLARSVAPLPETDLRLQIGEAAQLDPAQRLLTLPLPAGDVLAAAEVAFARKSEENLPVEAVFSQYPLNAKTRPHPTVTAAVDFVRDEVRRFGQMKQQGDTHETA